MVLGFIDDTGMCISRGVQDFTGVEFTFHVTTDVQAACTVDALGDANLGSVPASASGISGSTAIQVTCPTGTPYYVGLSPSNGDQQGAGALKGTGSNTDQPAYQLCPNRARPARSGATPRHRRISEMAWRGTGSGTSQGVAVYVTVPSANFHPDVYADTVTITVNY